MAIRKTKPTSPGRRFATYQDRAEVTTAKPNKKLTKGKKSTGGRNANGRVTARHRGGGAKRKYRQIDFKRTKDGVPAKVATIEYDPNRTTYIALLHYADGAKSYILAPQGVSVGDEVQSGPGSDIRPGNALELGAIPTGTVVHNVELKPGQGGRMGRAAGTAIQVVAKDAGMVTLRLPSSEMRMVEAGAAPRSARSPTPSTRTSSSARPAAAATRASGRRRRGIAMNPVDHPHGGGEAHKGPGGHPKTPWGKPTLGYRTRKKNKQSSAMIVRGRRRGKKKGR